MTHEEAVVHLARTEVTSYKQLPVMLYQIQTKYRDEARPRGGLIRVREFTMKDAYSFHRDEASLSDYYEKAYQAYERIFQRIGMKDVVIIRGDSGMMGGKVSHEFMAVAETGEDTIFISPDRSYLANREVATTTLNFESEPEKELEKVHTPDCKTIDDLASFLGVDAAHTCKVVFYQTEDGKLVIGMIRGDIEINETKLKNHLHTSSLTLADEDAIKAIGAVPGYASPMDADLREVHLVVDPSAAHSNNLVVGANDVDYHYKNFNFQRDLNTGEIVDIGCVREGDPCPVTGAPLQMCRGIEVGNIFQLGTKYSESMQCNFLDENGKSHSMIMGCYGIGVERSMAAVIEQSHDKYGPIWPLSIAPYHVHIVALNPKKENVASEAEKLYQAFLDAGIEVLYDDRGEKAGSAFNDADLLGIPFRVIISPKTLQNGEVEFKTRDGETKEMLPLTDAGSIIGDKVKTGLEACEK
jgi:prolyl-tRNA synthetase